MRQDSSSEFLKVSELQNIQVQQGDGESHPQWWRAWQKIGLCPSTLEKVGLFNNTYVKTSTETKQSEPQKKIFTKVISSLNKISS